MQFSFGGPLSHIFVKNTVNRALEILFNILKEMWDLCYSAKKAKIDCVRWRFKAAGNGNAVYGVLGDCKELLEKVIKYA